MTKTEVKVAGKKYIIVMNNHDCTIYYSGYRVNFWNQDETWRNLMVNKLTQIFNPWSTVLIDSKPVFGVRIFK